MKKLGAVLPRPWGPSTISLARESTQPKGGRAWRGGVARQQVCVALALTLAPLAGWTQSCDMLSYNINDARSSIRRAAAASDLDEGQDHARRLKSSLDYASMSAMDCKCDMAYLEFDTAASRARRAEYASDGEEFVDNMNRAIKSFNLALDYVRMCAAERRR